MSDRNGRNRGRNDQLSWTVIFLGSIVFFCVTVVSVVLRGAMRYHEPIGNPALFWGFVTVGAVCAVPLLVIFSRTNRRLEQGAAELHAEVERLHREIEEQNSAQPARPQRPEPPRPAPPPPPPPVNPG